MATATRPAAPTGAGLSDGAPGVDAPAPRLDAPAPSGGSGLSGPGGLTELGIALDRIGAWTRRHAADPDGMSMTARYTLGRLHDDGPHRLSDLARLEGVSQPAMSTLINRLESDGLVRRAPDSADGRVVLVGITSAGTRFVRRRRDERAHVLAEQIAHLPEPQREALSAALPALRNLTAR